MDPLTENIKTAFVGIQAEDSLKENTLRGLHEKMQTQAKPRTYINVRRLATMAACLILVLFSGVFSYNLYFTETAYIDLDINPSLELTINRFDRVIGVEAYNTDAEALLSSLNLRHKNVDSAIDEIIAAAAQTGALEREGLVSVTVQSLSGDEAQLLESVQAGVSTSVSHHGSAAVDVFSVDSDTRTAAHDLHISPAKYLAILELQAVDPSATIEECSDHSIGEIKQRTQAHSEGGHHDESSDDGTTDNSDGGTSEHHDEDAFFDSGTDANHESATDDNSHGNQTQQEHGVATTDSEQHNEGSDGDADHAGTAAPAVTQSAESAITHDKDSEKTTHNGHSGGGHD